MYHNHELNVEFKKFYIENLIKINSDFVKLDKMANSHEHVIWNKAFDLLPSIVFIPETEHTYNQELLKHYFLLLQKVIYLYKENSSIRKFYNFTEEIETLCCLQTKGHLDTVICRFDTYISSNGMKILENNCDCPAGVIFTGRHAKLILNSPTINRFIEENTINKFPEIYSDDCFLNTLLKAHENRVGNLISPKICILQERGKTSLEVQAMLLLLEEKGISTIISYPDSLHYENNTLYANGEAVNLVWNKINTCYFNNYPTSIPGIKALFQSVKENSITHLNSFASRYICENKKTLALFYDENFKDLFNVEEHKLINKLLPFAVMLNKEFVTFNGVNSSAAKIAKLFKNQFVIKHPYDIRGEGVIIGMETLETDWEKYVDQLIHHDCIIQEYIKPPQVEINPGLDSKTQFYNVSLDCFMFNGKFVGYGSKLSKFAKVNIFQGGSKNIILYNTKL